MSAAPVEKGEMVKLAEKASHEEVVTAMTSKMRKVSHEGAAGLFRNVILGHVTEERYEEAMSEIRAYVESKHQYPQFQIRSERYAQYGIELIQAIQAKRSFPGWNVLNMSKQKELFEKALLHFEDLKATLKKIEALEKEIRVDDVRSTVWVVKACVFSVSVLLIFGVLKELTHGVLPSANVLIEAATGEVIDYVFEKLKL